MAGNITERAKAARQDMILTGRCGQKAACISMLLPSRVGTNTGGKPLSTEEGVKAFMTALIKEGAQQIVIAGRKKINKHLGCPPIPAQPCAGQRNQ